MFAILVFCVCGCVCVSLIRIKGNKARNKRVKKTVLYLFNEINSGPQFDRLFNLKGYEIIILLGFVLWCL